MDEDKLDNSKLCLDMPSKRREPLDLFHIYRPHEDLLEFELMLMLERQPGLVIVTKLLMTLKIYVSFCKDYYQYYLIDMDSIT
jgi:hypothetical protein